MATEMLPGSAVRPNGSNAPQAHAREPSRVSDLDSTEAADFAESMALPGSNKSPPQRAAKDAADGGRVDDRVPSQKGVSAQGAAAASEDATGEAGSQRRLKDAVLTKADAAMSADGAGRRIAHPSTADAAAVAVEAEATSRAAQGRQSADGGTDQVLSKMRTQRQGVAQAAPASATAGVSGQTGAPVQDPGDLLNVGRQGRGEAGQVQVAAQVLPAAAATSEEKALPHAALGQRQMLSTSGDTLPGGNDGRSEPRHVAATPDAPPQPRPAGSDLAAAIAPKAGDIGADGRRGGVVDGGQVDVGRSDVMRSDAARGEVRADPATAQMRHDSPQQRGDTPRSVATQMVEAIRPGRDGGVDLALNPQELGRVRLTLQGSETTMHVSITSDRPETQDLLRRNIATLEQQFQELGYGSISFDFGDSQGRSGTGRGQAPAPVFGDADIAAIADGPATPAMRGLDLRV